MLAYLFAEYGNIDNNALAENEKWFVEPWDGVEQMENVFTRIHECIDFAKAAEQPYMDKQILSRHWQDYMLMILKNGISLQPT
jgi:hypothetical protein